MKFSHKDLLSLPWCFIWYKLQPKNSSCLHASFILHVDAGWLIFFLFHFFIKMAPSWTAGAWTLLAALGLLSCCSFSWCEASRTSSSTSGGSTQDQGPSSLERVKRGWVWNQFFVVEEYTGTEPLYVGKVRHLIVLCKCLQKSFGCRNFCFRKEKKNNKNESLPLDVVRIHTRLNTVLKIQDKK